MKKIAVIIVALFCHLVNADNAPSMDGMGVVNPPFALLGATLAYTKNDYVNDQGKYG